MLANNSKMENIEFLMSSRTTSSETSTEKLRMIHMRSSEKPTRFSNFNLEQIDDCKVGCQHLLFFRCPISSCLAP